MQFEGRLESRRENGASMAKKWYVVQAYSGYEGKVKSALEERVRQNGMEELFGEILIPKENVQDTTKSGTTAVAVQNSEIAASTKKSKRYCAARSADVRS